MQPQVQVIGKVFGEGRMYLYGKLGDSLLEFGEAHRDDAGFWYFAESYEYPSYVIWAIAGFLYRTNHAQGGINEVGTTG